jgi:hypothetical protein
MKQAVGIFFILLSFIIYSSDGKGFFFFLNEKKIIGKVRNLVLRTIYGDNIT